jgi:hypothetical protein
MININLVEPGKIAFGKTEIMNGIQQVSFSDSVISANARDSFIEMKGTVAIVFEMR